MCRGSRLIVNVFVYIFTNWSYLICTRSIEPRWPQASKQGTQGNGRQSGRRLCVLHHVHAINSHLHSDAISDERTNGMDTGFSFEMFKISSIQRTKPDQPIKNRWTCCIMLHTWIYLALFNDKFYFREGNK